MVVDLIVIEDKGMSLSATGTTRGKVNKNGRQELACNDSRFRNNRDLDSLNR